MYEKKRKEEGESTRIVLVHWEKVGCGDIIAKRVIEIFPIPSTSTSQATPERFDYVEKNEETRRSYSRADRLRK